MSSADQTVPLGLCGVLMMSARVRGVSAAAMRVEVGREGARASAARAPVSPPASAIVGP